MGIVFLLTLPYTLLMGIEMEPTEMFRSSLRYMLENSGCSQADLARTLGVAPQRINDYLKCRVNLSELKRQEASNFFDMTYLEMLTLGHRLETSKKTKKEPSPLIVQTRTGKEQALLEKNAANYRGVPLMESGKLAAWSNGSAFNIYEKVDSEMIVYLPELGHHANHNLVGARVGGDSMEPVIPKDSIVIVDLDDREFADNKTYVININEGGVDLAVIKRVRKAEESKGFVLLSENPKDLPRIVVESDWLRLCIGRVIWMWRSFNG